MGFGIGVDYSEKYRLLYYPTSGVLLPKNSTLERHRRRSFSYARGVIEKNGGLSDYLSIKARILRLGGRERERESLWGHRDVLVFDV